jgi:PAS domain S-box-containing protein
MQAFFDRALDAMVLVDDEGCCLEANSAACRLFALSNQDFLSARITDFISVQPFSSLFHMAQDAGTSIRGELHLIGADSLSHEVEYTFTFHFLPGQHLFALRDITRQKRIEAQVQHFTQLLDQQAQAHQRALNHLKIEQTRQHPASEGEVVFPQIAGEQDACVAKSGVESRQVPDSAAYPLVNLGIADIFQHPAIAIVNGRVWSAQTYDYQYCSPQCESLFGICPDDLIQDPSLWWNQVEPDDLTYRIIPAFSDILAERSVTFDYRFQHRDGSQRWFSVMITSRWDEVALCWWVTTLHLDISDRKKVEHALQANEAHMHLQQFVMMGLARSSHLCSGNLEGALQEISQAAAHTLDVERVGVWLLQESDDVLVCAHLYTLSQRQHSSGESLSATNYPIYFQAIRENPIITATDACQDSRTREFVEYFTLYGIRSVMDVPIRSDGRLVGILCLEHVETPRVWKSEEQHFATYLSSLIMLAKEVGDRKLAERILRRREQEFRALVENAPDAIMRLNPQFQFLYVNPKVEQLTGISAHHFRGKTSYDMKMPSYLVEMWHGVMERACATCQEQALEYEMSLPSGVMTFYSRVVPELRADGSVASLLVIARDITNLKKAQTILLRQAQEEQLIHSITQHIRQSLDLHEVLSTTVSEVRSFLQADRTIIYRFNPDGSGSVIAESVEERCLPLLGRRIYDECLVAEECLQNYREGRIQNTADIYQSDLPPCYIELLENLQIRANLVLPILQGEQVWGLLAAQHAISPRHWQSNEVDLLRQLSNQVAIAIQQSELYHQVQILNTHLEQQVQERTSELSKALQFEATLKRITDEVRDSLDETQILRTAVRELAIALDLDCCDTALYNHDQTLTTIYCDYCKRIPSAEGVIMPMSDYPELYAQVAQDHPLQFCPLESDTHILRPGLEYSTVLLCPLRDEQGIMGDMWLFKPSEQSFDEIAIRLAQQVANQCAIALRQSRLYQASQAQVLELEKLNRLKDDFLSTVSHELRSPMASIVMAGQMLEIQLERLEQLTAIPIHPSIPLALDNISHYVRILKTESQREIELINDLLDLTRLDAHVDPLNLEVIDLHIWLPHIAEAFVERSQQQQQQLRLQLPADFPTVITDKQYLQRIVCELLHNACKYTPSGGIITLTGQRLSIDPMVEQVELSITNTGVEIAPQERDRIFERFYRIPNNDPWKHGGTGLGLALVKKLVDCLGGTIQVQSAHRETCFTIQLPCCLQESLNLQP